MSSLAQASRRSSLALMSVSGCSNRRSTRNPRKVGAIVAVDSGPVSGDETGRLDPGWKTGFTFQQRHTERLVLGRNASGGYSHHLVFHQTTALHPEARSDWGIIRRGQGSCNRFDVTWFAMKSLDGVTYFPSWIEIALLVGVGSGVLMIYSLLAHFFRVFSETVAVSKASQRRLSHSSTCPGLYRRGRFHRQRQPATRISPTTQNRSCKGRFFRARL